MYFFFHGVTTPSGPGPPHYRGLTITLRHTPHFVGLLWMSDQPPAASFTWQPTTLTRDKYPRPDGNRTHNPRKRSAAYPRFRSRAHWDRLLICIDFNIDRFVWKHEFCNNKFYGSLPYQISTESQRIYGVGWEVHVLSWVNRVLLLISTSSSKNFLRTSSKSL
jgi:hypothetical protein